jgi:hypothetical protein
LVEAFFEVSVDKAGTVKGALGFYEVGVETLETGDKGSLGEFIFLTAHVSKGSFQGFIRRQLLQHISHRFLVVLEDFVIHAFEALENRLRLCLYNFNRLRNPNFNKLHIGALLDFLDPVKQRIGVKCYAGATSFRPSCTT